MKTLYLLLFITLSSCNQGSSDREPAGMDNNTVKMITTTEDSLGMMNKMMNDTGITTTGKMELMHHRAGMIEKNTAMLMNDSMMWMDAGMKCLHDSLEILNKKLQSFEPGSAAAMKLMEEKTLLLQKQWQKTKAMREEMEMMKQIGTTRMHQKKQ